MTEHFSKTYTSPEDLVKLLMSRGLQVSNEAKAAAYLRNIGYFRLSAYFYPFLKKPKNLHQYKKRSSFNKVLKLYRFDRKLRLMMFKLSGNDIFNGGISRFTIYSNRFMFTKMEDDDSRCVTLSLRYRFNVTPSKYKGTGAGNAEKNRL